MAYMFIVEWWVRAGLCISMVYMFIVEWWVHVGLCVSMAYMFIVERWIRARLSLRPTGKITGNCKANTKP